MNKLIELVSVFLAKAEVLRISKTDLAMYKGKTYTRIICDAFKKYGIEATSGDIFNLSKVFGSSLSAEKYRAALGWDLCEMMQIVEEEMEKELT